jgi:putative nucleotidyltransferase with HDIG domain
MDNSKVLLVHDDETIARYIREKLITNWGFPVAFELTTRAGLETFQEGNFEVVIVKLSISDEFSATELIKSIKKIDQDCVIIAFLEDANSSLSKDLARLGVYDFVSKPINLEKLFFLVQKGAELHSLLLANRRLTHSLSEQNSSLQKQNTLLAKRIEESTKNLTRLYEDLRTTYMRTIKVLAQAIDARDHYTHSHSEKVAKYAVAIAEEMGLPVKDIELIRDACELHDLGKIGVEDKILLKSSGLTPEEWEDIKRHPITGAQILEPLTFLDGVIDLVKHHHEHYDGSGYPSSLKGDEISLGARIIHLADAFEAMTSARAYRKTPLNRDEAIYEIKKNSGTQFDPRIVEAFLKIVNKI